MSIDADGGGPLRESERAAVEAIQGAFDKAYPYHGAPFIAAQNALSRLLRALAEAEARAEEAHAEGYEAGFMAEIGVRKAVESRQVVAEAAWEFWRLRYETAERERDRLKHVLDISFAGSPWPGGRISDVLEEWAKRFEAESARAVAAEAARDEARRLIASDAWAISFQTMGQYRTALLRALSLRPAGDTVPPKPA